MRVTWLVWKPISQRNGVWYSPIASTRYRVLPAAMLLAAQGHVVNVFCVMGGVAPAKAKQLLDVDAIVVSKVPYTHSLRYVEYARQLGTPILFDVCDDYFRMPASAEDFRRHFDAADRIVSSTQPLAEIIQRETGRTSAVIDDPYEAPLQAPKFDPHPARLNLLWFGGLGNHKTISTMIPDLVAYSKEQPLHLHVVSTAENSNIREFLQNLQVQNTPSLTTRFTDWTLEGTWKAIEECDLVVIPSCNTPDYTAKSPNRMVESLRCGRFVSAFPLPTYRRFADFSWLGENVVEGARWALNNQELLANRIADGQAYVESRFSPAKLARLWEREISLLLNHKPPAGPTFLRNQSAAQVTKRSDSC